MSFCLMDPIKQTDVSTARRIYNGEDSGHCFNFLLRIWKTGASFVFRGAIVRKRWSKIIKYIGLCKVQVSKGILDITVE
jgi:hypothetical protein